MRAPCLAPRPAAGFPCFALAGAGGGKTWKWWSLRGGGCGCESWPGRAQSKEKEVGLLGVMEEDPPMRVASLSVCFELF